MDDLIARARRPTRTIEESIRLINPLTDALEAERKLRAEWEIEAQDLRDRVVQMNQELATSRAAHEVTAQERDRATTELAMMRKWQEKATLVLAGIQEVLTKRLADIDKELLSKEPK